MGKTRFTTLENFGALWLTRLRASALTFGLSGDPELRQNYQDDDKSAPMLEFLGVALLLAGLCHGVARWRRRYLAGRFSKEISLRWPVPLPGAKLAPRPKDTLFPEEQDFLRLAEKAPGENLPQAR